MSGILVSGVTGQPSPSRAERRTPTRPIAPIQSGGCGSCHGWMCGRASSSGQNRPACVTWSSVQSRFIRATDSSSIANRAREVDPRAVNSSSRYPAPIPTTSRPRLMMSSVASSSASATGW